MHFYEVWVRSNKFHGLLPLTYSHDSSLENGSIVMVQLRQETVLAIVTKKVQKPPFATKPILNVLDDTVLPAAILRLLEWMQEFYPSPIASLTQLALPKGLLRVRPVTHPIPPFSATSSPLPVLTKEQKLANDEIQRIESGTFLLHGDTGTGKTRLYMELATASLAKGRSVIVLTPEIGLTPQLLNSFQKYFTHHIITIHSHLTEAERRTVWLQALKSTEPVIIIGPRSAVFTPLNSVGLVIVDEAHESAYKQEQAPYYHGLRVASKLAQLHKARLVIGTATPPVSEYYLAKQKNIPILRMQALATGASQKTSITLVNLREREHFSRQHSLSNELLDSIKEAIGRKEQSLVFLNRRGTARLVLCQVCGWQVMCPRCDIPLTYHGDSYELRCHTCGLINAPPTSCENCQSTDIVFKSVGTKAIVDALQKEFPHARIKRFDTDNLKADRFEQHYDDVWAGKVDILVGTQMLTKGLDLPKLSVIGVVLADSSLYFPDYTAEEQTYQMLTQVLGRIGRGHIKHAEAIIQTYHPESPAIVTAVNKDWQTFYEKQILEREQFMFPPFCYTLKLYCERRTIASSKQAAEKLLNTLQSLRLRINIIGPAPSFHEKNNGKYRWQLIVKAKDRKELLKIIPELPSNWSYDIDPITLL